jgi:Ca2+-binding RTX toxin-like protein
MGSQFEPAGTLTGMIEQLETRRLLDATLVDGVITVTTNPGVADIVIVSIDKTNAANVVVTVNDTTPQSFVIADATGISIDTGDGDDRIGFDQTLGTIALPATIHGGDGNDRIDSGAGADRIFGGAGDDVVLGGDGRDSIYGEDGNDLLFAGGGSDFVDGGVGEDDLWGGDGHDTLRGGTGNDDFYDKDGAGEVVDANSVDKGFNTTTSENLNLG